VGRNGFFAKRLFADRAQMLWLQEFGWREVVSELIELWAFFDAAFTPALRPQALVSICTSVGGSLTSLFRHGAKRGMRCPR
jgi:hypothetical protein